MRRAAPLLFALALGACSTVSGGGAVRDTALLPGWHASVRTHQHLYVAYRPFPLVEFEQDGLHAERIFSGVLFPSGILFDRDDDLYVATGRGENSVFVYPPGTTSPAYRISSKNSRVADIALDPLGRLCVAWSGRSFVSCYVRHGARAVRTIARGIVTPRVLAIDRTGTLYVAVGGSTAAGAVAEYAPAANVPTQTITNGIDYPVRFVFDRAGNLYVANIASGVGGGWISVYAPGATKPARTIFEGINTPVDMAFDAAGNLYVANFLGDSVTVYAPRSTRVLRAIFQGLAYPSNLAFDDAGDLYVGTTQRINVYAPGGNTIVRVVDPGFQQKPGAIAFSAR